MSTPSDQTADPRLPAQQAADPHTPAGTLALLAASSDPEVRRRIATNPAAPAEALRVLGREFPGEVLDNPSLPLHAIDDPSFFSRFDLATCRAFLDSPRATPELCMQLAGSTSEQVRLLVARASITPLAVLEQLARASNPYLVSAVAIHPTFPLSAVYSLLLHPHEQVALTILQTGRLGSEGLVLLAHHPNGLVRRKIASLSEDPLVLGRMAQDPEWMVRRAVASNPHTPEPVLWRLRRDATDTVRKDVLENPSTKRFALLTLLRDPSRSNSSAARLKLQALWLSA